MIPSHEVPKIYIIINSAKVIFKHMESQSYALKYNHSWTQRKLSPLSLLNILLSINSPLLSLGFNGFND